MHAYASRPFNWTQVLPTADHLQLAHAALSVGELLLGKFAKLVGDTSSGVAMLQDKSWRVRYNVAQQLCAMCEALGPEVSRCCQQPCMALASI